MVTRSIWIWTEKKVSSLQLRMRWMVTVWMMVLKKRRYLGEGQESVTLIKAPWEIKALATVTLINKVLMKMGMEHSKTQLVVALVCLEKMPSRVLLAPEMTLIREKVLSRRLRV